MSTTGGSEGRRQVFYRYKDETGRLVIVDSASQVPAKLRGTAERVELDGTPQNPVPSRAASSAADARAASAEPVLFHAPSFLLGLGAAGLLAALLFSFRAGGSRTLAKLVGGAALAAVLAGAYFGWLRRSTGQSDSLVSTPGELVDDARRAVDKVEERRRQQQQVLDTIERESK